ncbi:translocase of chloroplast 120, chloroplastic-like [Tasmannia lanceolata]|uniref:translocase of chloroplast 120, chloroplastic-like n=1 Tax=Tasmannia lanceolata TaxID=3420 RepID=UPI004064BC71
MENYAEIIDEPGSGVMNGSKDVNLELKLEDQGVHGVSHERKASEADEVFEEAMEVDPECFHSHGVVVDGDGDGEVEKSQLVEGNGNPNEGFEIENFEDRELEKFQRVERNGNPNLGLEVENFEDIEMEKPHGVEGNGDPNEGIEIENFEEAMDLPSEEQSREDEEKGFGEKVGFLEVSELVDDARVASVVDDDEQIGEGGQTLTELNGTGRNGVSGKGEGDGEEVSDAIVCGEMKTHVGNDEGTCEMQAIVRENSGNGDFNKVESNGVHVVVHERSENGDFDKLNSDGIALSPGNEANDQISDQDRGQHMHDATVDVDTSANEDIEALLGENSPPVEVLTEINESINAETCESAAMGWQYSDDQCSGDTTEGTSEQSVVTNGTDELGRAEEPHAPGRPFENSVVTIGTDELGRAEEPHTPERASENSVVTNGTDELGRAEEPHTPERASENSVVTNGSDELGRADEPQTPENNGEEPSIVENSTINESPGNEFVSLEEYADSTSTDEDDNELSIQPAPVASSSVGESMDPRPPTQRTRPAGLGSFAPPLEPAPRVMPPPRVNGTVLQRQPQPMEDPANGETEEYDETREKLQMIRVKFLRLAHRLGQTPHNVVVAQVLYRLGLAEQLRGSRNTSRAGAFSFDRASAMAEQLEAAGQDPLDFSCTIMVIGKTGVGKSATINSIFDEVKFNTNAFQLGTQKVQDIVGTVQGIKVRVIDTPGLLSSCLDQRRNEKILHSVKRFINKTPPDIVLYLDRLDMQSRDYGDVPLLRTITDIFGPSIWFNAIVVLTHAASAPPDGPSGTPLSYEMFVTQRSHVVQQAIRQAAGDVRLMNPVSLVENHSACRTNRAGQRVLPNGQVWKPHLLLLSFASKILAEANTLLNLQDGPPGKPFGVRSRVPPLPFLLSSLLQSRPQVKLPEEQFGDEDTMDEDLDEASDSDEESEYDELPPFKRLTKSQVTKLSKAQKNAYFDELEYREKLFMKKQLKEERKRRKLLKKLAASAKDLPSEYSENLEEESGGAASVPVPMPDLALPTSFDSDNPTHRYRYLDSSNQWLVRPVLDSHGWDHDVGYEGLNVERLFVVKDKIPISFSGQVTKDKKESNLQMELASSIKHGEGKATSLGFDMQTVGKDIAYTLRSETRFSNFKHNKTAAGLSVTVLGDALTAGLKLEDKLMVHKRFRLVVTGGAMTGRGDVAFGGSLEATLRDKDHPIGRTLSTLGLSIMDWHGDLAIGCNVQSQFPVGRTTNMIARANLNNKGSGQVSIRLNSSEQLQMALIALIPVFRNIIKNRLLGNSQPMQ